MWIVAYHMHKIMVEDNVVMNASATLNKIIFTYFLKFYQINMIITLLIIPFFFYNTLLMYYKKQKVYFN